MDVGKANPVDVAPSGPLVLQARGNITPEDPVQYAVPVHDHSVLLDRDEAG